MARWVCPNCDREFGRIRQSHTCVPGGSVAETLDGFPEGHRVITQAVIEVVESFGPVYVDPVGVGVFFSTEQKFAELRPRQRWLLLYLMLPTSIERARVRRREQISDSRVMHVVRLDRVADVDEELAGWLLIGYEAACTV